LSRDQRDAILDARGTRRQVSEVIVTQMQPPPNVVHGGGNPSTNISVVTTETPAASQAGTQFGRQAHGGRG